MPHSLKRRLPIGTCVARYVAGDSISQVARAAGVTRQAMWEGLRRARVAMRPQQRYGSANNFYRGGGRKVTARGYIKIYVRGRWIFEHRIIMARVLGRPLRPDEDVRRRNGRNDDNRPANLFVVSHAEGTRLTHAGRTPSRAAVEKRRATIEARYGDTWRLGWLAEIKWLRRQSPRIRALYLQAMDRLRPQVPEEWRRLLVRAAQLGAPPIGLEENRPSPSPLPERHHEARGPSLEAVSVRP